MKLTAVNKSDEEVFLLAAITIYFFNEVKVDFDRHQLTGLNEQQDPPRVGETLFKRGAPGVQRQCFDPTLLNRVSLTPELLSISDGAP